MLQIKEWQAMKACQLEWGHFIKPGETGYTISLFVSGRENLPGGRARAGCTGVEAHPVSAAHVAFRERR